MAETLRVLAVHGVGNHFGDLSWQDDWTQAIASSVKQVVGKQNVDVEFCMYDDLFDHEKITVWGTLEAVAKLTGSLFGLRQHRSRSLFSNISERVRWTAGMVVQWVENERLREKTRARLSDSISNFDPHIVVAHSLGALVAYDTFSDPKLKDWIAGRAFISFGSQIANRFVLGNLRAGRIEEIPAEQWYHLYNPDDDIFTAPIRLSSANFRQVVTKFDLPGFGDHDAVKYLGHRQAITDAWGPLVRAHQTKDGIEFGFETTRAWFEKEVTEPRRRALLVGINNYANPAANLEGCVNDVYLFSEVIQEAGFDPADIRLVLNERATADAIRERLEWLVDGAGPRDQLVFYYSGHGAQMPTYNDIEIVDRMLECLVPHDFDWTTEKAVTDKQIYELYSQLPYECQFLMFFDCCHSGGMHRLGAHRAKGIDPPDDIRHRMMKWEPSRRMWSERALGGITTGDRVANVDASKARFVGSSGGVEKLGGAAELRSLSRSAFDKMREEQDHLGPFMPIIFQACQEEELAFEYRQGATSYGAFTYSVVNILRQQPGLSFQELCDRASANLVDLGYQQTPIVRGPSKLLSDPVPLK